MINKGVKLAALFLLVALFAFTAWNLREFGEPGEPGDQDVTLYKADVNESVTMDRTAMDGFVLGTTQEGKLENNEVAKELDIDPELVQGEDGASTNNAVTAVVFDYRGFDTIGEATVLFAAVSGVLIALRTALPPKGKKGGDA